MQLGNFFKRILGFNEQVQLKRHPDEIAIHDEALKLLPLGSRMTLRYPPFLEGYPVAISNERLLNMQDELVSRIRRGIGLTYEEANEMLQPALLNYARFVHLLPASENHHHCGPGGLLRHGLEVAYIAMNCSKNAAFDSRLPPSKRSLRNPRWIVAGALCGLFHDTGKAVTDMRVVYAPEDLEWDYTSSSIEDWGKKNRLEKYYIEWQKGRHKKHIMRSRDLFSVLCPPNTLTWLREGGDDLIDAILDAIVGNEESPLYKALMTADAKSTKSDMATGESPQYMTGVPVIKLVTSAMVRLVQEEHWQINAPGARVWTTSQGVFIAWTNGALDIINLILSDDVKAIPRTPASLLMRLCDEGIAELTPEGEMLWEVAPDCIQKIPDKPIILKCMKLASGDTLFPYDPIPSSTAVRIKQGDTLIPYQGSNTAAATPSEDPARENLGGVDEADTHSEPIETPKPKKGKAKGSKEKASDQPVKLELKPSSQAIEPAEPAAIDPVLSRMADLELNGGDQQSQQEFLNAALMCFSGLSEPEPEPKADRPALQPTLTPEDAPELATVSTSYGGKTKKSSIRLLGQKAKNPQAADSTANTDTGDKNPKSSKKNQPESKQQADSSIPAFNTQGIDLQPSEIRILSEHPELAELVLEAIASKVPFGSYSRRVFIPLASDKTAGISEQHVPQLHNARWLWMEIGSTAETPIVTINRKAGIVPAPWLGEIISRNSNQITGKAVYRSTIDHDIASALYMLAEELIEKATPETLPEGQSVLRIYRKAATKIAEERGMTFDDAVDSMVLAHDATYSYKKNTIYFTPSL